MSLDRTMTTRSMKIKEKEACRQVFDDNNSMLDVNVDAALCHESDVGSSKPNTCIRKEDCDVRSICSMTKHMTLDTQCKMDEQSARLKLEAELMRKRADMMEMHSLMLKESRLEMGSPGHKIEQCEGTGTRDRMTRYLRACKRQDTTGHTPVPRIKDDAEFLTNSYPVIKDTNRFDLPKVELPRFGGNPNEYWSFIRQFEAHIESRTSDPGQRLLYLMSYCYGDAKEAIQGCTILPPDEGYLEARVLLKRLFGRSHVVSRNLIDEVLNFPRIQRYDGQALTRLYVKMNTCWKTLNQMNYLSDINAVGTIQKVVDKLPDDMVDRWIRESYRIYEDSREPEFMDLIKFIDREAAIAQTRYAENKKPGERATRLRVEPRETDRWKPGTDRMIHHIDNQINHREFTRYCLLCKGDHKVAQCEQYNGLSVTNRWDAIKNNGGCFSCLSSGHTVKNCRFRKACGVDGCERKHHSSLHVKADIAVGSGKVFTSVRKSEREISLGIVPINLIGPKGRLSIYALLDSGANTTLIRKDVIRRVGILGETTEISVNTIVGETKMAATRCSFSITEPNGIDDVRVNDAYAVEEFPIKLRARSHVETIRRWPHLKGIPELECEDAPVSMIIGCDQPKAHWVREVKNGSESQPFGMRTPLGWVVLGPVQREAIRSVNYTETTRKDDVNEITNLITKLYNNEFNDIGCNEKELSRDERTAVTIVTQGTIKAEGKYTVPLPWKSYPPRLSNNRSYAMKRLLGLKRRFQSSPDLAGRYNNIFVGHITKNYIVKSPVCNNQEDIVGSWYLPHHPVLNPKKPDKLRIVFDCAAQYQGKSINDCLFQGPDTIACLVGVLIRFRRLPIVIMADIEEMFLQVRLQEKDQNWMKFLWWRDGNVNDVIEEYKMLVHPFGARSSPFCTNFALRKTIEDNERNVCSETADIARRNLYVDDCIASVSDVNTAVKVIKELTQVMSQGGFRLCKWLSNRKEVLMEVPENDLAKSVQLLINKELPDERALGVEWAAESDILRFKLTEIDQPCTRRGVLSTIATVFDPLGLVSPIVLRAKMLLQRLCRDKMSWDQHLEADELSEWTEWKAQMKRLPTISFPRCVRGNHTRSSKLQLHIFADASELGYGAVAYIRSSENGTDVCNLLMSKARVAPLKIVTIPRLELNAAVLAVRMYRSITKEFDEQFERVVFWVDSSIVLRYLHNTTSRFATFVANRIQEILESTTVKQWRHIHSELNPADYASRGLGIGDPKMDIWINGPKFLRLSEEEWPVSRISHESQEDLELRTTVLHVDRKTNRTLDALLDYYSSWSRMIKAAAWLTRYKNYLRVMTGKGDSVNIGKITVEELNASEDDIIKYVQGTVFPEECNEVLKLGNHIPGFRWHGSRLRKLCPRDRNGILVVSGRCGLGSISEQQRHPIILPHEHPVTTAVILDCHEREGHSGISHTLAKLREKWWVLQGGATVKRMIRRCLVCRRLNATAMKQQMADLPLLRVQEGWFPFQYVGVDYFGPFQVRRGRLLEKRYGCIFTCLQCRAVHLELAQTLSTDSFILALMRFVNRRGSPKEIHSDNGGNFIGAEKELGEWLTRLEFNKVTDVMTERRIVWKFNPPLASHRGGIWERMIRSVRKILNSVAGRGSVDEEVLWTYLSQAERIINDRPLTPVRDGQNEPVPIRVSDLLQPKGKEFLAINLPLNQLVEKRWRIVNSMAAEFWRRWKTEYLNLLYDRQKWTSVHREPKIDDLVITEVESTPRTYWPLGVITELIPDSDGKVRTVGIKTAGGPIKRDIRKVYLLEGVG